MSGPEPEDLERAVKHYAIYAHPDDFREGYVVREWLIAAGHTLPGERWHAATLEEARALLPAGVTKIADGDPQERKIVEVWM